MNAEFGLTHVWTQGDTVTRVVFCTLLLMSLVSWIVIVMKSIDLLRYKRQSRQVEAFWHADDLTNGLLSLGDDPRNPYRAMVIEGREATAHHRATRAQLHDSLDVSDWISRALRNSFDVSAARLQSGLAVLASVGSTAPFVGLFGTVWGIYHALMSISSAGEASIDKVAGPIGEALIMTALGLAVAIPAVLGYNALVRGNKGVLGLLRRFGNDLLALYVTGARVAPAGEAGASNVMQIKKA